MKNKQIVKEGKFSIHLHVPVGMCHMNNTSIEDWIRDTMRNNLEQDGFYLEELTWEKAEDKDQPLIRASKDVEELYKVKGKVKRIKVEPLNYSDLLQRGLDLIAHQMDNQPHHEAQRMVEPGNFAILFDDLGTQVIIKNDGYTLMNAEKQKIVAKLMVMYQTKFKVTKSQEVETNE